MEDVKDTRTVYKSYIKTILGALYINTLDDFNKPIGIIVKGDPRGKDRQNCIIDTYNDTEDLYFKRNNRKHFEQGYLIEYERKETDVPVESSNIFTDEQLITIINSRFLSLQSAVNKMTSVSPVSRLIGLAREYEKSEKIISFLERRLSEIQESEFTEPTEV